MPSWRRPSILVNQWILIWAAIFNLELGSKKNCNFPFQWVTSAFSLPAHFFLVTQVTQQPVTCAGTARSLRPESQAPPPLLRSWCPLQQSRLTCLWWLSTASWTLTSWNSVKAAPSSTCFQRMHRNLPLSCAKILCPSSAPPPAPGHSELP